MNKNEILLLDYNHRFAYWLKKDELNKFKKVSNNSIDEKQAMGYAIQHKNSFWDSEKYLCSLFVEGEAIFFLAGKNCFDVTSDDWSLIKEKSGFFNYHLILKKKKEVIFDLYFKEVAETQPGDPDASFFVDMTHWLRNSQTKMNLIKYWKGELA